MYLSLSLISILPENISLYKINNTKGRCFWGNCDDRFYFSGFLSFQNFYINSDRFCFFGKNKLYLDFLETLFCFWCCSSIDSISCCSLILLIFPIQGSIAAFFWSPVLTFCCCFSRLQAHPLIFRSEPIAQHVFHHQIWFYGICWLSNNFSLILILWVRFKGFQSS